MANTDIEVLLQHSQEMIDGPFTMEDFAHGGKIEWICNYRSFPIIGKKWAITMSYKYSDIKNETTRDEWFQMSSENFGTIMVYRSKEECVPLVSLPKGYCVPASNAEIALVCEVMDSIRDLILDKPKPLPIDHLAV